MSHPSDPQTSSGLIRRTPGKQKPWLAFLVSYVLPGGGQFYNRQFIKGVLFLLVLGFIIGPGSVIFRAQSGGSVEFTFSNAACGIALALLVVFSIDACLVAVRLRRGEAVHPMKWF